MFRISNVSKKMVGFCALVSTLFIFNACGSKEDKVKEISYNILKQKIDNKGVICSQLTKVYEPTRKQQYEKMGNLKSIDYKDSIIVNGDGGSMSVDKAWVLYDLNFENLSTPAVVPLSTGVDYSGKKLDYNLNPLASIQCGDSALAWFKKEKES